jgi:S1-C subfamily serine protease
MKRHLALAVALAIAAAPGRLPAGLSREVGTRTMPGVVFLLAGDIKGGKLVPVASGSGSVLTPDGAVLTNHHVLFDKKNDRLFDFVAIGLLKAYDQAPDLTCLAVPRSSLLDRDLDLALVKCETDLQGRPFRASGWPTIPVGDSGDLVPATEIYIMGYPGVGGSTIHVTRGTVSGFLGKDGGSGRFWIKTDAAIAHGNSGGTAIDEAGNLIGIPTAVFPGQKDIGEKVGLVRPVELARALISAAQGGWEPTAPAASDPAIPPPTETPASPVARACAADRGVTISGRILANDNHGGIEGAFVVVLRPGTRRKDVKNDYSNLDDLYLTYALSNQDGAFQLLCPVPRDAKMTVVVLAKGFVELSADDVLVTQGVPDAFEPWGGKVFLQRAE